MFGRTEDFMYIWTQIMEWLHRLTPWAAFGMAALESLFPPIPLTAVVAANVAAFGALFGFLYSWLGSAFGSSLVFFAVRGLSGLPALRKLLGREKLERARSFVGRMKPLALFLLIMLPFTPSSFVNFACGVSHYSARRYLLVMLPAKAVMIASLSLLGESLQRAANPLWLLGGALLLLLLYLLSKRVAARHASEERKKSEKVLKNA